MPVRAISASCRGISASNGQLAIGEFTPNQAPFARRITSSIKRRCTIGVFAKLAQYDFDGWAVLEWECCLKSPEAGAREGAEFIAAHIIPVTDKAFDDFAAAETGDAENRHMLGLSR